MKYIKILAILCFAFLVPQLGKTQNIAAWSVIEYDSIAPASVVTKGTRLAYSKKYNSFYRWDVLCLCWKRFAGPGITDTSYTLGFSSPNLSLLGSGSSTSLTDLYTAGYGLIKTAETWKVDTTSPNGLATRLFAKTLPTSILTGQVAYSNGSNLVGSANHFWDNANNRLGIGTTTPSYSIHSRGSSATGIVIAAENTDGNSVAEIVARNNVSGIFSYAKRGTTAGSYKNISAGDGYLYNSQSGNISFTNDVVTGNINFAAGASSTAQMTLNTNGNVLIGTTTDVPTSILTARSTTKSASPFPLHTTAESNAITGVSGNFEWITNTIGPGLSWYNGTRKAYAVESSFVRGGNEGRIPYINANLQLADSDLFRWSETNKTLGINTTTTSGAGVIIKNVQEPNRVPKIATQTFGADTTNWTRGSGWTFNGTAAVATLASGSLDYIASFPVVVGRAYEVRYTMTAYSAGTLTARVGTDLIALPQHDITTNNVLLIPLSATGGFRFTASGFSGRIDDVLVTEISNPSTILLAFQDDNSTALYTPLRVPNGTTWAQGGGGSWITGTGNNIVGLNAGLRVTNGSNNNLYGSNAGGALTSGNNNNIFGLSAGQFLTIGTANNFFGNTAGQFTTSGNNNNFFGTNAGQRNTLGGSNNYFGTGAGGFSTSASQNNMFGSSAGSSTSTGSDNNYFGTNAARTSTTAGNSIAIGTNTLYHTLASPLTGSFNTVIGSESARNLQGAASGNLLLGNNIDFPVVDGSNQVVIKNLIFGTGASGTGTNIATGGRVGVKVNTPLEDFHVVGDGFFTDSLKVTTTPAHTAITGLLTRDANGWLGSTAISGLNYSGGTLTAQNIGNTNLSLTSNRTLTGANYNLDFNGVSKFGINSNRFNFSGNRFYTKNVDTTSASYWGQEAYYGTVAENGFYFRDSLDSSQDGTIWAVGAKADGISYNRGAGAYSVGGGLAEYGSLFSGNRTTGTSRQYLWDYRDSYMYKSGAARNSYQQLYTQSRGFAGKADTSYYTYVRTTTNVDSATASNRRIGTQMVMRMFPYAGTVSNQEAGIGVGDFESQPNWVSFPSFVQKRSGVFISKRGGISEFLGFYMPTSFASTEASYNYAVVGEIGKFSSSQVQFFGYGLGNKEAADLSKTQSGYITGFATDGTVTEVQGLNVASDKKITIDGYTSSIPFNPSTTGIAPTDVFLATSATGVVLQRKMRQTSSVKDTDYSVTSTQLRDAQDIHIWAYCSNAASDSVVVDLPAPSDTYQGQIVSVYGDGRNATPNRDVYVRCVGAKLWYGNASPTGQTYYQVTSLSGGINSKTVQFVCIENPDDSTYYWQLVQHPN